MWNILYLSFKKSLKHTKLEVTHKNVLDNAVEGVECKKDKVFVVSVGTGTAIIEVDGNKITLVYKESGYNYTGAGGTEVNETYTFEVDKEKLVLTDNAGKSTTFIYEERVENPPR